MPVNEITHTTPVQTQVAQTSDRHLTRPAAVHGAVAPSAPAAVSPVLTPAQQVAVLINQALQNLNFISPVAPEALGIQGGSPLLTAIDAGQGLTPVQQFALGVNDTLNGLGASPGTPVDPLLMNETPPSLVETLAAAQGLTLAQQGAGQINDLLQNLSATSPTLTLTEGATPAGATVGAAQGLTLPAAATASPSAAVVNLSAAEVAATVGQTLVTTPAATPVTEAAVVTPTQPPLVAAAPSPRDPTPFAFAVYEVRDQNPAPGDPKPITKKIAPPLAPGRVRPVDRLILKREWERRGERGQPPRHPDSESLTAMSIHQVIAQANDDLARGGLPLRLVLASNDDGYVLDIYNCSGQDMCRLEQEIPIDLTELSSLLDSIQHETGIIINIRT